MTPCRFARASGSAQAIQLKTSEPGSMFVAGGTSLVDLMAQNVLRPSLVVDLNGLPLRGVERQNDGGLHIGALTTMAQVAWHEAVGKNYPVLMQALLSGATPQIHHAATVGGNLLQKTRCSYYREPNFPCNKRQAGSGCSAYDGFNRSHAIFGGSEHCIAVHPSDMAVGLTALDATVVMEGPHGVRRVSIDDFYLLPGDTPWRENVLAADELITAVEIPASPYAARSTYVKVDEHNSYSFAVVSVAAAPHLENNTVREARLAAGGVAHKPWRLHEAELALLNQPFTEQTIEAAASMAIVGAIPREHNQHKVELLRRTVIGALEQLNQENA